MTFDFVFDLYTINIYAVTLVLSEFTMSSISERGGVLGTVKGNGETETFLPKANFSLVIIAKVEGSEDGYIARITRAPDNVTR